MRTFDKWTTIFGREVILSHTGYNYINGNIHNKTHVKAFFPNNFQALPTEKLPFANCFKIEIMKNTSAFFFIMFPD